MRGLAPIAALISALALAISVGCAGRSAGAPAALPAVESPESVAVVDHPNLSIAARLLKSGQFLDAEVVLRNILRESPNCARAKFLLGVALGKEKRYAQARPLLEASIASGQPFADAKQVDHFLGWACYYLGDLDAAKRAFQAHVHNVPTAADSYYGLGVIAIDEDRVGDAESALQRSIALLPEPPAGNQDRSKALARLGDCALRKAQSDEALSYYEEAAALWPDHYEVWGKLARVYEMAERSDDAARARREQDSAMKRVGRLPETETLP